MSDQRNFSSAWSLFSIYCSIFFVLFHFLAFSVVVGEASGNELGNPSIAITKWIRKWSLKEERAAAHGGISSFGWWNYRLSFDMWTPLQLTRRVIIVCFHFFFSFSIYFQNRVCSVRFVSFVSFPETQSVSFAHQKLENVVFYPKHKLICFNASLIEWT